MNPLSQHLQVSKYIDMEVITLILLFFIPCLLLLAASTIFSKKSLLPSPKALPIIGHLHLLGSSPHQSLTALAKQYGPYMLLKFGSYRTLIISSAEGAKEALKTQDVTFSSRPALSPISVISYDRSGLIWAPYGDAWRRVRKLCTMEILSAKRVDFFRPVRTQEMLLVMDSLLQSSKKGEVVDVADILSDLTFNSVSQMVLGKSTYEPGHGRDQEAWDFKQLIREGSIALGDVFVGDYIPWLKWLDWKKLSKLRVFSKQMDSYLQKQVDEHRKNMSSFNDFLSIMLSSPEFSNLDSVIKALVWDVFAGGTDTSSVTVEWALAELLKNPEMLAKAKEELDTVVGRGSLVKESHLDKLKYLTAVAKETLRLHPPGPLLVYETTDDCKIKEQHIPKGTRTFVNAYAIARDAAIWEDPLKFNPQRFEDGKVDVRGRDYEVLPFGSGRRICPGIHLGMTMVLFMLSNFLHGFNWKMPEDASFDALDMSEDVGLTVPRAVPLRLVPCARLETEVYRSLLDD